MQILVEVCHTETAQMKKPVLDLYRWVDIVQLNRCVWAALGVFCSMGTCCVCFVYMLYHCVRIVVRACVHACMRACVHACVYVCSLWMCSMCVHCECVQSVFSVNVFSVNVFIVNAFSVNVFSVNVFNENMFTVCPLCVHFKYVHCGSDQLSLRCVHCVFTVCSLWVCSLCFHCECVHCECVHCVQDTKSETEEKCKATVILSYGYMSLYAPVSLIPSRLETIIQKTINPQFSSVKVGHQPTVQ